MSTHNIGEAILMSIHNIGFYETEAILMSTYDIGFYEDLTKIPFNYHQILTLSLLLHITWIHYVPY